MEQDPEDLVEESTKLIQELEKLSHVRKDSKQSWLDLHSTVARAHEGNQLDEDRLLALRKAPSKLAVHANDALVNDRDYFVDLIQILAVASRVSTWQEHFGCHTPSNEVTDKEQTQLSEPECVLEVARRVCTLRYHVPSSAIESALRIIANCCADNNLNRRLVIHRDGIDTLLRLLQHNANPDVLIPTIYNVCVDYDEPAIYLDSIPQLMTDPIHGSGSHSDQETQAEDNLSLSIERLGSAYNSNDHFATFELLLSVHQKLSEHIKTYLAELVEMAALPALCGWQHVRSINESLSDPWNWSCTIDDKQYDTVALIVELSAQSSECSGYMRRTVLSLLSQNTAIDALLRRNDDSIWTLLTLACTEGLMDENDEMGDDELAEALKASLKVLYQITGKPSFPQNAERGALLMRISSDQLENHIEELQSGSKMWSRRNEAGPQHLRVSSETYLLASACVVLSQLAASETLRDKIIENEKLITALGLLLQNEYSPDVLYPAVTVASRITLSPKPNLAGVYATLMAQMRRLLTQGGLGLVVPFETIIAYKTIVRGRPEVLDALFIPRHDGEPIATDILQLWNLTIEAGTKLETAKFFLEVLRTALPRSSTTILQPADSGQDHVRAFKAWLGQHSTQVADVFGWVCTKAEPPSQRDHGWFGLAMLSVSEEGQLGVSNILESQQELRDAVLRVSRSPDGGVDRKNLMLMVSKLLGTFEDKDGSSGVKGTLHEAAENLGLLTMV